MIHEVRGRRSLEVEGTDGENETAIREETNVVAVNSVAEIIHE